jgi:hypothetical protein
VAIIFKNARLLLLPCEIRRNSAGSSRALAMHTRALRAVPLTRDDDRGGSPETNLLTTMLGISFRLARRSKKEQVKSLVSGWMHVRQAQLAVDRKFI